MAVFVILEKSNVVSTWKKWNMTVQTNICSMDMQAISYVIIESYVFILLSSIVLIEIHVSLTAFLSPEISSFLQHSLIPDVGVVIQM